MHACSIQSHTSKKCLTKDGLIKLIPCPQKGGKFYPILLHKFITHRTGKIYLLFPDGLYWLAQKDHQKWVFPVTVNLLCTAVFRVFEHDLFHLRLHTLLPRFQSTLPYPVAPVYRQRLDITRQESTFFQVQRQK